MKDDVKTLAYDDVLPLQWVEQPVLPDTLRLERLSESNVGVLARVATIEERRRMVGEDGELEQEINRLHSKMDLLLGLVASIARSQLKLPEALRIDPAHGFLGLRLNVWTSILVGLGALVAFIVVGRRHPGRESTVTLDGLQVPPEQQEDQHQDVPQGAEADEATPP